jgi:type II secretory pathway predicted ATPase ExeA
VLKKFYNLSGSPFLLMPDSRFFFGSSGHTRAMAHLVYGLSQQEGFIVITGEVGAGKTMLVEQLWLQLDRNTYFMARVVTTQVSGDDLFRLAMASLWPRKYAGHGEVDVASSIRAYGSLSAQPRPTLSSSDR